jgi:hypothetical protein
MPDQTITKTALAGGKVSYSLGEPNWKDRLVPDIRRPDTTVQLTESRLIDVIILGDGFTTASDFRDSIAEWLADFYAIKVYDLFSGCLRVRALYTPSTEAASADRGSYYRTLPSTDGDKMDQNTAWWKSNDADGLAFRERFWESVDTFAANTRRYPTDLNVGSKNQAVTNTLLRDLYRNLVVCLLIKTSATTHPSGFTTDVYRPAPHQSRHVRLAIGAKEIHEFGHALGLLLDEYINGGRGSQNTRVNPSARSVFSLSNVTYSDLVDDVPWLHLSPCGWQTRTASGEDPSPLVGWLWVGGVVQFGAWHSEYRCLMNGSHNNFQFTQVAADDPTANPDGTYTQQHGAGLRDIDRFCLWCQEIVTLRILEKTDQLLEDGDPPDATSQGTTWYARWVERLRANYFQLFDVAQQILDSEARYATMTPGRNGEALWLSDLYSVPRASPQAPSSHVPPLTDEEMLVLIEGAAA